jgi:peptidoglycan/xylan/chitin deacetylase (PgdA/CDA1 family)
MLGVAAVLLTVLPLVAVGPVRAAAPTIVSLTFDDGRATAYTARSILAAHSMHATFYVNSPRLGSSPFYMTWQQVQDLYGDGNEIGGHTAYHADLTQVSATEAQRQICYDRVNLLNHGYPATDFAYPFGTYNANIESLAASCGYNSARTTSQSATFAETIPPQDPYAIRMGSASGSLSTLEAAVNAAHQQGGGWVPIVLHDICTGCSSVSITQADFTSFLDWLQQQSGNGVVVETVQQVVGGAVQPAVPGPALPPPPNGTNALHNASLELDTNADHAPDCWEFDTFGNNSFTWTRTTDAHTGTYAERVDVSNFASGDDKLMVENDLGDCSPTVTPGRSYRLTTWYKSSVPVSFTVFSRDSQWAFGYWMSSPDFPATSTWAQASWVTPVIPSGANGLAFGLTLDSNGSLTVDDAGLDDSASTGGTDTTAPTVSLTAPTNGTTVAGVVHITATASDNVAIDHVDFLVDGSVVGTKLTAQAAYDWNSRTVPNGSHTISGRAVDSAGNSATTPAISVFVNNQFANLLQNPSLETATGSTPTCWLLGGYGTNTFAWTRTADAHSGSFAENLNVTAYTSGDRKFVTAQDSVACAPAISAGHTYTVSAWYKSTRQPYVFVYYRTSAGSWVYWTQSPKLALAAAWTQASFTTPAVPTGATNISIGLGADGVGSLTMDDFGLVDNVPPPDTIAPTTTIRCNNVDIEGTCGSGYYNGPVLIELTATDNLGGSGVASIRYTTDGSDPTLSNGLVYSGPFDTTTTVRYRGFDIAGNAEAIQTQPILIETNNPTSSISCNSLPCSSSQYSSAVSVSLTATDAGGSGPRAIYYTTDGGDPSTSNGNISIGAFSVTSTTSVKYRAVDNAGNAEAIHTQLILIDTTAPTSTISCNGSACSSSPYSAAVSVTLAATDDPGGSGVAAIRYTTDGTDPTTTSGTVYSAAFTVSATTTVKYRAFDNAGNAEPVNSALIRVDTTAPTSTSSCNGSACSSGFYNSAVSVTLAAADEPGGSGVASIRYTTNGTDPTATTGTVYGGAFAVAASTTVKYRAFDAAGNAEAVNSRLIQIDTVAPTSTIKCNGVGCSGTFYSSTVSVTLIAADNGGGSGVASIRYTTNGTDPTPTTGTVYAGPFSLSSTTTVKYRSFDAAGNIEPVNAALLQVDTVAPTSTIKCNGAACTSVPYNSTVSVTLAATDDPGGSGVTSIRYTTNGTDPTATSGTVYAAAFSLSSSATVKYRAFDAVGNAEAVNSRVIQIDTAAPTISLTAPTANAIVSGPANLTATASDNLAVDHVDFLVDGSVVGSAIASPYGVSWASTAVPDGTHTISARAVDTAGNQTTTASISVKVANVNLLQNPSLETASGSIPTCWLVGGHGTNAFSWTRTSDAHTGSFAENLNVTAYTSGDRKFVNAQDAGACAPAISAGHTYTMTAWYKSTLQPYIFVYYRNSAGSWVYWTQSPKLAIASVWSQASFTTPAVPAGATNISIGMGIDGVGSLTMDDFGLFVAT